jgi:dynein heavy chain
LQTSRSETASTAGLPQGLFERHKLIVATQLCMAVLRSKGELQRAKFEFLLRGPKEMGVDNPLTDWVSDSVWGSVQALKELEDYASLPDDLVGSSKRWREWMELERPGVLAGHCPGLIRAVRQGAADSSCPS